jgi:DNA replication initiation complex subunit (GINS family)
MEKIDYAYLRTVQNNERAGMGLSELSENFYSEASAYIGMLKDNNEKNPSMTTMREYENARRVFEDILNVRAKKIVLNVLQMSEEPDNILPEEKKIYETVKNNVLEFKERVFSSSSGEKRPEKKASPEAKKEIKKELKTEGFKKVKMLKDIPQYRGSDGSMYGPYKEGASVSMPAYEADFLVSKGMAE